MAKYLFACVMLVASRQTAATVLAKNCDYVLCQNKAESGDGYYAAGSAISSQFLMPDGSVVTNSKESSISSDGIKRTFHELKKEADKFVYTGSSNKLGVPVHAIPSIPHFPGIPVGPKIPITPDIPSIPLPQSSYSTSGSSGSSQHSSYSSSVQSSGSAIVGSQQYQPVTPLKVTSYTKEHDIKRKVVSSSQGSSDYPVANIIGQYHNSEQNALNAGTVSNSGIRFPSESLSQNQESSYYSQQSNNYNPAGAYVPIVGSQSYEKFHSSSQKNASEVQPNYVANLRPNTFTTNVLDISANVDNVNQIHSENIHPVISPQVPSRIVQPHEQHYSSDSSVSTQKEYKYNAVPIPVQVPVNAAHVKYELDDHQIKTETFGAGLKQVPLDLQHGHEQFQNQASHSQTYVGTSDTNAAGLPRSHINKLVVQVGSPTASNSQSYRESSSSQVLSSHQKVPVQVIPSYSSSSSGHYESSGSEYSQQVGSQVPTGGDQSSSSRKHISSSQTTGHFQSPVIVNGLPQNVQIEQHSGYSGSDFNSGSFADGISIPILVHGVPQTQSSSSSSSGSSYYTSSGQVGGAGFYNHGDVANKIRGASASIYDRLSANSDAELCTGCVDGLSSSYIPIQNIPSSRNSYGISTSFSSSSSSVNGQKTSENREASIAVNDNGKVDSYHVKL